MKFRQQKSGSWAFFRFFSARRRHLSWVYLFQEISLYRAYGQEDTTKRIVMNLKAMLLTGLFILLKYTVSSSQRLVLSNCGYLTLTFFACQEVFYFFWFFIFGVSFGAFLFHFGERILEQNEIPHALRSILVMNRKAEISLRLSLSLSILFCDISRIRCEDIALFFISCFVMSLGLPSTPAKHHLSPR